MTQYIWQSPNWPNFRLDYEKLLVPLGRSRFLQGQLYQQVATLGLDLELQAQLEAMTLEAVQTAAIEGEFLNPQAVRSSVAKRLGLPTAGLPGSKPETDGLVDVLMEATGNYQAPLTPDRLKGWHAALFPTGYSGLYKIRVAEWRPPEKDPMRIVSGPEGRERVHYIAPPASRVESEMETFLHWWEGSRPSREGMDLIIRAGIAHYWFLAIHPFEDGNGRLARALADLALTQGEGVAKRCYSLSNQIMEKREGYYRVLDRTSRGDGDLTGWMSWFLECYEQTIKKSQKVMDKVVKISRFWQNVSHIALNERQRKVIGKLLEAGPGGFEGGLKSRKYLGMTGASRATGHRDMMDLVKKNILRPNDAGGRSSSYELCWELTGKKVLSGEEE
ncbi:MAG: Fic family protein [Desulfobacterales bacterium]|nr:Fic family protein [Desulfobacterales bacterium]